MESVRVRDGQQGPPLLDRDALPLVFKMLGLEDLKSCRQVCREWCEESTAVMRQNVKMVRITNLYGLGPGRLPSEFLELMRVEGEENAVSNLPFQVYLHCSMEELQSEFWKFCGGSITKMSLLVKSSAGNAFRHAVFQSCVNLEALTISVQGKGNVEEPKEWVPPAFPPNWNLKSLTIGGVMVKGVSWMEILSQFPALEKFEQKHYMASLKGFFGSLAIARKHDEQCWKIKHLSFNFLSISTPLAIVPILTDCNLPLRTLKVGDIGYPEDALAMKRILAVHASTLNDLSLYGGFEDDDQNQVLEIFPLPNNAVLENVTKFCLKFAKPKSVSFLQSFPNLKKLELIELEPTPEFAQEQFGKWILKNCTELSIYLKHFRPEDLRHLMRRLPNLEKLKASSCDNDKFAVICELLPKLIYLHLEHSSVTDIGISGLTEEDCRRINHNGERGGWWPSPMMARPNLSRLKNLERLKWSGIFTNPGYTSALYVQQLPKLQHLLLPRGWPLPLHPFYWERLLTQFPWPSEESAPEKEWPLND